MCACACVCTKPVPHMLITTGHINGQTNCLFFISASSSSSSSSILYWISNIYIYRYILYVCIMKQWSSLLPSKPRLLAQLRWNKTSVRCMCVCVWVVRCASLNKIFAVISFYWLPSMRCRAVIWARINTKANTHRDCSTKIEKYV